MHPDTAKILRRAVHYLPITTYSCLAINRAVQERKDLYTGCERFDLRSDAGQLYGQISFALGDDPDNWEANECHPPPWWNSPDPHLQERTDMLTLAALSAERILEAEMALRAEKLAILKRAYKVLGTNNLGLCYAIEYAALPGSFESKERRAMRYLLGYVKRSLKGYSWLQGWLEGQDIVVFPRDSRGRLTYGPVQHARLLATRKAWCQWLANCYEEDLQKGLT
jgi:hypothetical protein